MSTKVLMRNSKTDIMGMWNKLFGKRKYKLECWSVAKLADVYTYTIEAPSKEAALALLVQDFFGKTPVPKESVKQNSGTATYPTHSFIEGRGGMPNWFALYISNEYTGDHEARRSARGKDQQKLVEFALRHNIELKDEQLHVYI